MPSLRLLALVLSSLISLSALYGQVEESETRRPLEITSDVQVGMLAGGQIANEQFVYKSGLIAQYSVNTRLSPWIQAGLGMAIQNLETETIIPFFIDVKAQLKEGDRSPLLGLNIGSSSGTSTYYRNFANYDYHGGFYFSPYYSFRFPLGSNMDFMLATGYIHQVGWIEYFTEYDETYLESFSMDFLTIRAGIRF